MGAVYKPVFGKKGKGIQKNFGKIFMFAKVKKLNKRVVPQLKFRTEQFRVDV
mgnify:FL=1